MFKVCLIDFEEAWAARVIRGLNGHGLKCRRARAWAQAPVSLVRSHMFEEVVLDAGNPASVQSVIQGCNYLFVDVMHALQRDGLSTTVRRLRALCDGLREGGGDRIILMTSSCLMPRQPGAFLASVDDVYLPAGVTSLSDQLAMVELELYRYAADAMHTTSLHTGVIVDGDTLFSLDEDINTRFNVIHADEVIAMMASVTKEGRAGHRYALGGVNTDAEQWRATTDGLMLPEPTAAQWFGVQLDQHLDVSQAIAHLHHRPAPSLKAVVSNI